MSHTMKIQYNIINELIKETIQRTGTSWRSDIYIYTHTRSQDHNKIKKSQVQRHFI